MTTPTATTSVCVVNDWLNAVREAAFRKARASGHTMDDSLDIAQEVALYAWERSETLMQAYPIPGVFAAARYLHAMIGWRRVQGRQRGEGVAFHRSVDSLEVLRENREESHVGDDSSTDIAVEVIRRLEAEELERFLRDLLDPRSMMWLVAVKGHGRSVASVAEEAGVARETVSRCVNRALRLLAEHLEPLVGDR